MLSCMTEKDCTVIIPAPDRETAEAAAARLSASAGELADRFDFLVAVGAAPSAQRNLAIRSTPSKYVLFLDSDVTVPDGYWPKVLAEVERGLVDVVGGPVLLGAEASETERIFQDALSHPLAVGNGASRYSRIGERRGCGEAELILSNLLVRRSLFEEVGGFSEDLYPNEENEWLDRLSGKKIFHDPDFFVERPQRKTWEEFGTSLFRYGEGRTRQALVSGKWQLKNALPLVALGLGAWAILKPRQYFPAATLAGLGYLGALCTSTPANNSGKPLLVGLADIVLLKAYTFGQISGFRWLLGRAKSETSIMLYRYDLGSRSLG